MEDSVKIDNVMKFMQSDDGNYNPGILDLVIKKNLRNVPKDYLNQILTYI